MTRRPDFTIIVPVSLYHHVSYAETYSRVRRIVLKKQALCVQKRQRFRFFRCRMSKVPFYLYSALLQKDCL